MPKKSLSGGRRRFCASAGKLAAAWHYRSCNGGRNKDQATACGLARLAGQAGEDNTPGGFQVIGRQPVQNMASSAVMIRTNCHVVVPGLLASCAFLHQSVEKVSVEALGRRCQ